MTQNDGTTATPDRGRRGDLGVYILLVALGFVLYARTAGHTLFFSWDDHRYILENDLLVGSLPAQLRRIFTEFHYGAYLPVTLTGFALQHALFAKDPTGYHLVNALFHGGNGLLVYHVQRRLRASHTVALGGALLFLVHPLAVESVAWVSELKNLLSLFFLLLAFLAHSDSRAIEGRRVVMSWGLFALSVFAKPISVGGPLVFMAFDALFSRLTMRRVVLRSLPHAVIGLSGAVLILLAHKEVGAIKESLVRGTIDTLRLQAIVLWDYAVSTVAPLWLDPLYLYSAADVAERTGAAAGGATVALASLWLAVHQPLGRPQSRFAVLWGWVFILPVFNIVPIAVQRADRYTYVPFAALTMLAALAVQRVLDALGAGLARRAVPGIAALALVALAVLTGQRIPIFRNDLTLFSSHLQRFPLSESGVLNEAVYFFRTGRYDEAQGRFEKFVVLFPQHPKGPQFLGKLAMLRKDYALGAKYLERALALEPDVTIESILAVAHDELGRQALAEARYAEAASCFEGAIRHAPTQQHHYNNLGHSFIRLRQPARAIPPLEKALQLNPDYVKARCNLVAAHLALDHKDRALSVIEQGLERLPQEERFHKVHGLVVSLKPSPLTAPAPFQASSSENDHLSPQPDTAPAH